MFFFFLPPIFGSHDTLSPLICLLQLQVNKVSLLSREGAEADEDRFKAFLPFGEGEKALIREGWSGIYTDVFPKIAGKIGVMYKHLKYLKHSAKARGFTLIELVVTLAILATFIAHSYPRWQSFLLQREAKLSLYRLQQIIDYTRTQAIISAQTLRVAPLVLHYRTDENDWDQIVEVHSTTGQLIKTFPSLKARGNLTWRGSLQCTTLTFKNDGSCNCQGRFIYRSPTETIAEDLADSFSLTLSISGQTRLKLD